MHETVSVGLEEALTTFVPDLAPDERTTIHCCETGLLSHAAGLCPGKLPDGFHESFKARVVPAALEVGIMLVLERRAVVASTLAEALDVSKGPVRRLDLIDVVIDRALDFCIRPAAGDGNEFRS